jgi:hypothetical protein
MRIVISFTCHLEPRERNSQKEWEFIMKDAHEEKFPM